MQMVMMRFGATGRFHMGLGRRFNHLVNFIGKYIDAS